MIKFTPSEKKAKSLLDKFGEEKCKDLLDFKIADVLGQSYHQQDTKLLDLLTFEKILDNEIYRIYTEPGRDAGRNKF